MRWAWKGWRQGSKAWWVAQTRKGGAFSILHLPDSANYLTSRVKRNLSECSFKEKGISGYLSITLAGNPQLSWRGHVYWNSLSSATEKVQFPLQHCFSLPRKMTAWWSSSKREQSISFGSLVIDQGNRFSSGQPLWESLARAQDLHTSGSLCLASLF